MSDTDFGQFIVPVATALWGEPNASLSNKRELRWGTNGARSVNVDKGVWTDWNGTGADGNADGGGVLALVMRENGCDKPTAVKWLEEEGFIQSRRQSDYQMDHRDDDQRPEPPPDDPAEEKVAVKGYRYTNKDGDPLYEVIRFQFKRPDGSYVLDEKTGNPKKTFAQRRAVNGNAVWNLEGVEHTIYRHAEVEKAIEAGQTIFLPEGEKDVETFEAWGLVGSTNSGGAKHWTPRLAAFFKDADVVIPIDNDDAGRAMGQAKARSLKGIARRIRILDFASIVSGFPNKGDVTDWKDRGGTIEQLQAIIDQLPDWMPTPPPSKYGAEQFEHIGRNGGIAYDWLIKGIIERSGVFVVAGEMQAGKSFFTIDMGMKVAQGVEYCRRKVKQGLVVYVACEDAKGVKLRTEGYRREHGLENEAIPFVVMTKKLSLMEDKGLDEFIAECRAWQDFYGIKLELIFIDTFSVATEGLDEIQSAEVGRVLGRVNRIAEQTGAAVGLVHHLNAEAKRVRGHSSLTANVSQVIEIRPVVKPQPNRNLPAEVIKDGNARPIRRARLVKNKNGPNTEGWQFVLRQIDLGKDADGFPITTCVMEPPDGGDREVSTAGRLSPDQKLVLNALQAAIEDNPIEMPAGVRVGGSIHFAANYADWVEHVRKTWTFKATTDVDREKELQAVIVRTGKALLNSNYMGRDNDRKIVWNLNKEDRGPRPEPKAEPAKDARSALMSAADAEVPF